MFKKALVLLLLLFSMTSVSARVFKWVDEKGVTHYSESAPPRQKTTELATRPAPPATRDGDINPETLRWQRLENEFQKHKAERKAAETVEELEQENAQRRAADDKRKCIQAQRELYVLQQQLPVFSLNEKGERVYLEDKLRPAEIENAKQEIKTYCTQP